jgi:thioester reductase-like protein
MARVWRELLTVDQIGMEQDFFTVGGHSLLAAQLLLRIKQVFGVSLPLQRILLRPTIRGLSAEVCGKQVSGQQTAETAVPDFDARERAASLIPSALIPSALIPSALIPSALAPLAAQRPSKVLLTGATGFVGAYLVRELLDRGLTVYCLVRAPSTDIAQARLRDRLKVAGLGDEERVHVIAGDLASPRLGLSPAEFNALGTEIDLILHNGAQVDAVLPYERLSSANIDGTAEVLRLAVTGRTKPLHYVSTVSAGPAALGRTTAGYANTKWHAERLVEAAGERGVPVTICRLPRVTAATETGPGNDRDIMFRLLRDVLRLGQAPDLDLAEDWVPVDEVARCLADISLAEISLGCSAGARFRLVADEPVRFAHLVKLAGPVDVVPVTDWLAALADQLPEEHVLLRPIFQDRGKSPDGELHPGFKPVRAGHIDDDMIRRYLEENQP